MLCEEAWWQQIGWLCVSFYLCNVCWMLTWGWGSDPWGVGDVIYWFCAFVSVMCAVYVCGVWDCVVCGVWSCVVCSVWSMVSLVCAGYVCAVYVCQCMLLNFFFKPHCSGCWITRSNRGPIGLATFDLIGYHSRSDMIRTQFFSGSDQIGSGRLFCPTLVAINYSMHCLIYFLKYKIHMALRSLLIPISYDIIYLYFLTVIWWQTNSLLTHMNSFPKFCVSI